MKYYVRINYSSGKHAIAQVESERDALNVPEGLKRKGIPAKSLWVPESAADIHRQLKKGAEWCKGLWHLMDVKDSKSKSTAMARLMAITKGKKEKNNGIF